MGQNAQAEAIIEAIIRDRMILVLDVVLKGMVTSLCAEHVDSEKLFLFLFTLYENRSRRIITATTAAANNVEEREEQKRCQSNGL